MAIQVSGTRHPSGQPILNMFEGLALRRLKAGLSIQLIFFLFHETEFEDVEINRVSRHWATTA